MEAILMDTIETLWGIAIILVVVFVIGVLFGFFVLVRKLAVAFVKHQRDQKADNARPNPRVRHRRKHRFLLGGRH